MYWHRAPRRGDVLWFAVLLACLLPGSLRAQTTGEDATSRESSVYPDPNYGQASADAVSREYTVYPDPNYGQASADAASREYTVFPDTSATLYPDAVSREYAFWYFEDETAVGDAEDIPGVLTLRPPQPNPFTGTTKMIFGLPHPTEVSLSLFDVTGRRVQQVILPSLLKAGWHTATINAGRLQAGVYFCELNAGGITKKNKLVIR